eukprot:TRINITY_DN19834_c0_g1_i1.p1 TRINITY_DN19834_c0_g1~~TRINITY_DN19834_c0_g1_i1.p1  ORF type:complete len:116 (+),score=15.04 TRINITY_DN19834_c0_g1_i1:169-516(+)
MEEILTDTQKQFIDNMFVDTGSLAINMRTLDVARLIFSMILGVACGILGFASLGGVLFFVAGMSLLAFFIFLVLAFQPRQYFTQPWVLLTHNLQNCLFGFVLFWAAAYNAAHVIA